MTYFGQVVIGPPGSGKSTYCQAIKQFLANIGRKVSIVNLDPANDTLVYQCDLDISELITVTDVMDSMQLGPNGGLVYCMEFLERNKQWLRSRIEGIADTHYFLFDCPGQVELYTHHTSVKNVFHFLSKELDIRLAAVHIVDSHYCTDPSKFVSVLLTSLSTMLQIELPHVNVLSKVDLMENYGRLDFNIDFYTEVLDLQQLMQTFEENAFTKKFKKLNQRIVEIVEDYSLVSFIPMSIKEPSTMGNVMAVVDKANGYIYGKAEGDAVRQMYASTSGPEWDKIATVREKYMHLDENELDDPAMDLL